MEALVSLPSNDTDLGTAFNYQQYLDVALDDETRVEQCTTGGYTIQQFKVQGADDNSFINVVCNCQSGRAPSASKVVLQVYDRVDNAWEDLAEENEVGANTDFTFNVDINSDLDHYYDGSYWVSFRVYQRGI